MTNSKRVAIVVTVIAALGTWTLFNGPPRFPVELPASITPPAGHLAASPHAAVPMRAPVAAPARPDPPAAVIGVAEARMADATPIDERVRALTASGDPEQSFKAYRLVRECMRLEHDKDFREEEMKVFPADGNVTVEFTSTSSSVAKVQALTKSCASMSGRTRLDHHRLLEKAVDHHVAGALLLYLHNGPQGDADALRKRPDDPMVAAWREEALRRLDEGVRTGDPDALMTSVFGYSFLGKETTPAETYMLFLATNKVLGAIRHDNGAYAQPTLDNMSLGLNQQQKAEAEQRAEQIFQTWKTRKT